MPDRGSPLELRIADRARRDIRGILSWTEKEFGKGAKLRYEALLIQALGDIVADPDRPGSMERPEIMAAGARTYHLEFSRARVKGPRVKAPRHFLLYRRRDEHTLEVARVVHDSRDLARHLPVDYRR